MKYKNLEKSIVTYLIPISLVFTACQTGYVPNGPIGGYADQATEDTEVHGSGLYVSSFSGNGYTATERATDLSFLRCAERAWQDGYNYIVKVDQKGELSQTGTTTTASAVPITGGGAVAFGFSEPIYAPNGSSVAVGLLNSPSQNQIANKYKQFKIDSYFDEIKKKYNITPRKDVRSSNKPKIFFQNHLDQNVSKRFEHKNAETTSSEVSLIDYTTSKEAVQLYSLVTIGQVAFGEIPFEPFNSSSEEFKTAIKRKAESINANLILINKIAEEEKSSAVFSEYTTVSFCYKVNVKLGVKFDPEALKSKELKIRTVSREGDDLQYGDVILAVDGVDVLSAEKKVKYFNEVGAYLLLGKKPGDNVVLDVIRNNKPVKILIKLLENK